MKKTLLYERHLSLGATIIDFGGWAMPVQYTTVMEEHRTTRQIAGIFDICHMGEIEVRGTHAYDLLQRVLSRNLEKQKIGQMKLSAITTVQGGIIDDVTIYRLAENHYMVVTNAVTKEKDLAWLLNVRNEMKWFEVEIRDLSDEIGKIDLQGPRAMAILNGITEDDLDCLAFYHFIQTKIVGVSAVVSRSGYTGEDGFEIYVPGRRILEIWDKLIMVGDPLGLRPAGLGARDTLRLEAGMMLYGNEINETITPLEANYTWITDLEKDFIGCEALKKQKQEGVWKKIVGFEMIDRGIARHGYKVFKNDQEIGVVTSGTFSPTLNKAIGFAFVSTPVGEPETEIYIEIRNRLTRAKIVPTPFYKRKK
jgi:aminomethyltransferase